MKNKYHKYFTTPFWVYISIFIVTLILFVVALLSFVSDRVFSILIGISCSLLASMVVGILSDYTNTKRVRKNDNCEYNILVETLKSNCISLIENMPQYANAKVLINERHNYFEWIEILFSYNDKLSKKDNEYVIKQFVPILEIFKNNVDSVLNEIKYFISNGNIDEELKSNLERLSFYANAIMNGIKCNDYDWCAITMKKYMSNAMFEIFPELEEKCNEEYSELAVAFNNLIESVTVKKT